MMHDPFERALRIGRICLYFGIASLLLTPVNGALAVVAWRVGHRWWPSAAAAIVGLVAGAIAVRVWAWQRNLFLRMALIQRALDAQLERLDG